MALQPETNLTEAAGLVTGWNDSYDETGPFFVVQNSSPTIATSADFNDQLVITGNGVDQSLEQTLADHKWPGGAVGLVTVMQLLGDGRGQIYADRNTKDGMQLEKDSSNQISFRLIGDNGARAVSYPSFNSTLFPQPVVVYCYWNGVDTMGIVVDGDERTTGASVAQIGVPVDSPTVEPRLFSRGDNQFYANASIGDMVIKFGGFSHADLEALQDHWLSKYGT